MAGLTGSAVRNSLAFMNVRMTCIAAQSCEPVLGRAVSPVYRRSMTLRACNREMSSRKLKARFRMAGQPESRRLETVNRMTRFAAITITGASELPRVRIAMTVQTGGVLDFVNRVASGGDVTLIASRHRMLPQQRVGRVLVAGECKESRLEPLLVVTLSAVLRCELAAVRIVSMAVRATIMNDGGGEIA